jgi:ribosomal protein S18 acetylase RimI-like enzyme
VRQELRTGTGTWVVLRPARPDDEAFLYELYADRRAPELAPLGWSAEQSRAFVEMQFRAQQLGYGAAFGDADHWIVSAGGEPVARLLVARRPDEHRIVDVVVLGSWRGRGIGSALMVEVQADARDAGAPVRLTVEAHDARLVAWYRRLGFSVVDGGGVSLGMVWSPDGRSG